MKPAARPDDEPVDHMHVMPSDGRHEASRACWCQPVVDRRDPVTGATVWLHNTYRQ